MSSKLIFQSPVTVPAVDGLWIVRAADVNEEKRSIALDIAVSTGAYEHHRRFTLTISNGSADCLVPNPSPTFNDVLLQERRTSAGLSNAFEQVMGAYFMAGGTAGILQTLVALEIVPAGVVMSS